MRLLEHEGKSMLRSFGIPTPEECVVHSVEEAVAAAARLGFPVVVKAQVLTGGRGKAGGVKVVEDPSELPETAERILGMTIKGEVCKALLVAKSVDIASEMYAGITIDGQAGLPVLMFSLAGGMDIESVAATQPEKLLTMHLSSLKPLEVWQVMDFLRKAELPSPLLVEVAGILTRMARCFFEREAHVVEINPLVVTTAGAVMALDAKVVLDKDSLKRLGIAQTDGLPETELELRAAAIGVRYVALDGDIAVLGGGAGLGMATMDLVHYCGRKPACFIDCGGGITSKATAEAMRICLDTPGAKGVIFNAFGGGNNCETMALGVLEALRDRPGARVMVKMRGHSQDEGWALLRENGVPYVTDETSQVAMQRLINSIYGE